MLWTIITIVGGITGFVGMVLLGAVLDRRWGRGHFGAQHSVDYHVSEVEVMSRPPYVGP